MSKCRLGLPTVVVVGILCAASIHGGNVRAAQPDVSASSAVPAPSAVPGPPVASTPPGAPGNANEDIRDIRGPKFVLPGWVLPALLAGVALAALVGYGIWRRRQRRSARIPLPHEIALQRLDEARALMVPGQARELSNAASDIVRTYIEQRFGVIVTRRTTEEFLHDLVSSSNASLAQHRELLSEFLQQCDVVRFAAVSLPLASMESLRQSARAFVIATAHEEAHDSLPAT